MREHADREWTMTFPIEATAFVGMLIVVALIAVITFLATQMPSNPFIGEVVVEDFAGPMPDVDPGVAVPVTTVAP